MVVKIASFSALYAAPTATAKARIGQKVEDPMGGIWRYCRAGAAITNPLDGAGAYAQPSDCSVGVTAVGSWTIACTSLTVFDTITKNQFADGTIIIGAAAANRRFYHIRSNPLDAADDVVLTLYHPVRYAIAGDEWATIVSCPYYDVRPLSAGAGYMSVVCWPLQPVTSGYYFWGKTRGPVFGIVVSTVPGAASGARTTTFNESDGALYLGSDAYGGTSRQWAGYVMGRTGSTYGGGDQTIMTQLE